MAELLTPQERKKALVAFANEFDPPLSDLDAMNYMIDIGIGRRAALARYAKKTDKKQSRKARK